MLKNDYLDKYGFDVYHNLNEFINNYKHYYHTKREQKIDNLQHEIFNVEMLTFDDVFNKFIRVYLYIWKIGKYENVSIYKYDDYVIIYTKNKMYGYFWG